MAKVNSTSDKHSSISTRSHCAVTECLPVCLVSAFEQSLRSRRIQPIFTPCLQIVLSGLVSAGLPCCRLVVEIRCRFTRQLVAVGQSNLKSSVRSDLNQGLNTHQRCNKSHQTTGKIWHLASQVTEPTLIKSLANLLCTPCSDNTNADQ